MAPHFCAGGEVSNWHVMGSKTAPIIRYMHGWNWKEVVAYCKHKGWKLKKVKEK